MTDLAIGTVYETQTGPAEYRGLDHYHGETTHMFKDGQGVQYIKPGAPLDHHLNRGAPAALAPADPDMPDLRLCSFNYLAQELRRRGATVTPAPHGGDFCNG